MSAKNGTYKKCTVCEAEYYAKAYRAEASKYCSIECWKRRRHLNKCDHCDKPITSWYAKKYCSRQCSHAAMVGPKSAQWKGGVSLDRDRVRYGTELKKWRKEVFARDNYTCQDCGAKNHLHAHHIIEWAKDESKRFEVSNGKTLCIDCHGKVHGKDFRTRLNKKCISCGGKAKVAGTRCRQCWKSHVKQTPSNAQP
jgi:hypothetical protein